MSTPEPEARAEALVTAGPRIRGPWFPAEGLLTYEVPGALSERGQLKDAFKRVVPDAEQFLIGRSPAHV